MKKRIWRNLFPKIQMHLQTLKGKRVDTPILDAVIKEMKRSVQSKTAADKGRAVAETKMKYYDFFNGDADGIISLHQFYYGFHAKVNYSPVNADVKLLRHAVNIKKRHFTVFDISLLSNSDYIEGYIKKQQ